MDRDPLLPSARRPAFFHAPIEHLKPWGDQPRKRFADASLDELAASFLEVGMLEPILVRAIGQTDRYEIIAGERRWRAAQRAALREVPVIVRELTDAQAFAAALIENLQREDLSPLEIARAYERLIQETGTTLTNLAQRIGKDLSTISNTRRLLKLPASVQLMIDERVLAEGHGIALLSAGDPKTIEALARDAVQHGWSVRHTERRARGTSQTDGKKPKSPNTRDLEEQLARRFATRVQVDEVEGAKTGTVTFNWSSYDELDRLLDEFLLSREKRR